MVEAGESNDGTTQTGGGSRSNKIKFIAIAGLLVTLGVTLTLVFFVFNSGAKNSPPISRVRPVNLDTKNGLPDASSFCYDEDWCDARKWPGICETGKQQSPIDVVTAETSGRSDLILKKTEHFEMNPKYQMKVLHEFYAQNNGHTVQLELTPNLAELMSDLVISGGGLSDTYIFAQLHFHWAEKDFNGSEHTLNGHSFPLELHIVHFRAKYGSLAEALAAKGDREAVAVMAVFFHIEPKDDAVMKPIVEALSYLELPGNVTEFHLDINIGSLYPNLTEASYARYLGSLTTPTCNEVVVWTIFLESLGISEEQMEAFRHLRNSHGVSDFNYRPVQPLNARKIELYMAENSNKLKQF